VAETPAHLAGETRRARAVRRTGQLIEHGVGGIFPIAILCVAALGLVADNVAARREVVDFLLDRLPLTADEGRRQLERAMLRVTREVTGFGILGIATLLFAASNVMGSIRQALNAAFRVQDDRPPAQAKLWDFFMVFVFGVLVTLSLGLTLLDKLVDRSENDVLSALQTVGQVAPLLIAIVLFAAMYRFVPAKRTRLRDIWPGVLLAAIGYELAQRGFTLYLDSFANYGAIYASLGSVIAFLVFTYIVAFVALMGAEFAAEWPCVRDGQYDGPPGPPFRVLVWGFIAGLFVRR
jgi:membrane protein